MLKLSCDNTYNCIAASADDNPPIFSGKAAHGGVALLWKVAIDDYISPLDNIKSDRIVGIQCDFPGYELLFIIGVYLPSASHNLEEYCEYFDYLWALYDSLSSNGKVILMGDFNGDLGNSLGDKGKREPNERGLKLLSLGNDFNLSPVNLMNMCTGPLETFNSFCGRHHSTLDYIFVPNCFRSSIESARTFEDDPDNTSDHLPIQMTLNFTVNDSSASYHGDSQCSKKKCKIFWSKFSLEDINSKYVTPLLFDLEKGDIDPTDSEKAVEKISKLLIECSAPLTVSHGKTIKKKNKRNVYVRLPDDVKTARSHCTIAFESWKENDYPVGNEICENYRSKRGEYRFKLRNFLNQLEAEKITKLCNAAHTNEKLFWRLLKSQRSTSQMRAFLIDGKIITDKKQILDMWADHFEALGTPSVSARYDNDVFNRIATSVKDIFTSFIEDPSGVLNEPLQYDEVECVCSQLKPGVTGVSIDYEHIRFAGSNLWVLLHKLFQDFFEKFSVCDDLKVGVILPLFKGKGAKANNKDNYRGITLFPTLCKIYEMILLNRLEKYAAQMGFFSEMQFGFQEGVGCNEASFTILETINHMLERGSKIFSCFLDVRKAFDTVWIDGLLYKLFSELGIRGRMWLAIRDLYTNVKAQVFYEGSLSRKINLSQGTGQGRILAPFMYKVYVNGLLNVLSSHCYAIFINGLRIPSPSFADDISLLTLHPSFLKTFMKICNRYGIKWRYDFNHSKSGIVMFGETKPQHFESLKNREWFLGDTKVDELYEYKNLGVLKNYVGSFSSNIDDNIDKTRKKVGMIFSSNIDRRKVNPLIYVKFWRQACLPTLLFGAELFTLTPSLLLRLERCQSWFLKNIFYVPKFAPGLLLQKMSGLNSIESEIAMKKLLFLGRLMKEPKMSPAVKSLFDSRTKSFFDSDITSLGVLPSIAEALHKYELFDYFENWHDNSTFPAYTRWKKIVRDKIFVFERHAWDSFCESHPNMRIAHSCLENVPPFCFWSLANQFPDLVSRLHIQVRLMGNFGLNGCIPWLQNTDGAICFICKEEIESVTHFLLDCSYFRNNFDSLWNKLKFKIAQSNQTDGVYICNFITNLDRHNKVLLLLGGLALPFDSETKIQINRFISSAVGKIYKLRQERLRELEAPWLTNR